MSELEKFRLLYETCSRAWARLGEAGLFEVGLAMCPDDLVKEAEEADKALEKCFIEALHP